MCLRDFCVLLTINHYLKTSIYSHHVIERKYLKGITLKNNYYLYKKKKMKNIGVFYGSDNGTTQDVATQFAKKMKIDAVNVYDVGKADVAKLNDYDVLLLGSSTQGYGDLQYDWDEFIGKLESADLKGKKVAVFGLGDSASYSDTFCDAIATIAKAAQKAGATLIGNKVDVSDYSYDDSTAVVDGYFCGLPLDEDNESDKTAARMDAWIAQLQADIA